MGARGPAPKPTSLRKYEGNPSRRPFPPLEPQYAAIPPQKPSMSKAASKIWDDLVSKMRDYGVLREIDQRALYCLCEDEALIEAAYNGVRKMVEAGSLLGTRQGRSAL